MRWWWFGPAVSKTEISRELRAMKDAGIGGGKLQSVYLPNDDAWARFHGRQTDDLFDALRDRVGKGLVATILDAGYGLDFFDDEILNSLGKTNKAPASVSFG